MQIERDLHMAGGEGVTSYAKNSKLQRKALLESRPVLDEAVREAYYMAVHNSTMIIGDLGCSSGENTLFFVSKVIEAIGTHRIAGNSMELQFFLNDLPRNDFNQLFLSIESFKESIAADHKEERIPYFHIAGLPGSYYTKLFPKQSVHLFHSSYCLHWRSGLPSGLEDETKPYLNEGNIYIAKTTLPYAVKLYQEQFQKDMLMFLKLRYDELVFGGQMVLTFVGRKNEDVYNGEINHFFGLLAQSIQFVIEEGLVEKEKLDLFNLPLYLPSVDEVKAVVKQTMLDINQIKSFESNWDPYDDSEGDHVHDSNRSGMNAAKCVRAVLGPLLASHFGESVLDKLFQRFADNIGDHLQREKTKFFVIVLSLKRTCRT